MDAEVWTCPHALSAELTPLEGAVKYQKAKLEKRVDELEKSTPPLPWAIVYENNWRANGAMTHKGEPITPEAVAELKATHRLVVLEYVSTWPQGTLL